MVRIEFKIGGAAYWENRDTADYGDEQIVDMYEVARTIHRVADRIADGVDEGKIHDYNGNCVGRFVVE